MNTDGTPRTGADDPAMLAEMREFLGLLGAGLTRFDPSSVDVAAFRETAAKSRKQLNVASPVLSETRELEFSTLWGPVPARLYRPQHSQGAPALIYLHGGGWVIGSIDTHERLMIEYAIRTGFAVIGLDYGLAPEHPFPAALHQCLSCLVQIRHRASELSVDPARIAVGGDSAGATLAVALALAAQELGIDGPAGLLATYGAYDAALSLPSFDRFDQDELLLSRAKMAWFVEQYLPDPSRRAHPLASPLNASLVGLPPSYVTIAEIDVLADDSIAFADKARRQGASVTTDLCAGTVHGFVEAVALFDASREAVTRQCDWLVRTLA